MTQLRFTAAIAALFASAATAQGAMYTDEYDKAFRAAFRAGSIKQCVARGAKEFPTLDLTPTCACATDTLLANKSVQELKSFARNEAAREEMKSQIMQCLASDPPTLK